MNIPTFVFLTFLVVFVGISVRAEAPSPDVIIKNLQKQLAEEKDPSAQAKTNFAIGTFLFKSDTPEKSIPYFQKAIDLGSRVSDYAHFFLGTIAEKKSDFVEAKKHFTSVVNHQPASVRRVEANLELALIAQKEEHWGEAFKYLKDLEKKYRNDSQHPQILFSLFEAAKEKKYLKEACAAAIKIYSLYPTFGISKGWSEDLSPLQCAISKKNKEKRFDRLLSSGEFAIVRSEVKFWQDKLRSVGVAQPAEMGFLEEEAGRADLAEGKVKEAINHFTASQDLGGRSFESQILLGKAYSQTDDYPAAVESYMKAYKLNRASRGGQRALFQAAFLSYQNQDYDGAARKFEELMTRAKGKLAWNSQWHLAWIRYLKSDFDGALKAFNVLAQKKRLEKIDLEKLQYWRAMSLLRLGFPEEARPIFKYLAQQKRLGYYTAAAQARLSVLAPEPKVPELKELVPKGPEIGPAPNSTPTAVVKVKTDRKVASSEELKQPEGGSGESAQEPSEASERERIEGTDGESAADKPLDYSTVTDPALVLRFDRAKDLIDLGFSNWARAELREIEKRTRKINYLELLMSDYMRVGDFNRAAYIADVVFSAEREKDGIEGAPKLWNYAFPQAFGKYVVKYAKKFDVSPSLVWSIMRGESVYKENTTSSAGALGLMQLIVPTAKKVAEKLKLAQFKKESLLDPETNIMLGTWYLWRLNKVMEQSLPLVAGSYNAGPHRMKSWVQAFGRLDQDEFIEHIPFLETRNYVKKVLRNYFIYQSLYERKSNSLSWLAQKVNVKFDGPKLSSESWDD